MLRVFGTTTRVLPLPRPRVNYTTKTQYLFRINKGSLEVWDKDKVNSYVPPMIALFPSRTWCSSAMARQISLASAS